jgi:hypothetical protein
MIFFCLKKMAKIGIWTRNKAMLCNSLIVPLVFGENAIFSPKIGENLRKL